MSLNAKKSKNTGGGTGIAPLAPGTYPARLVLIADLGLQPQRPYQGQDKPPAYEILTTYELVDEFLQDEDGNDILDKPRWVSENFPLFSLSSERAKSTVRYNAIAGADDSGDWSALIGKPVMVTLVQNPGKGASAGKVFTNVTNVSAMRAKDIDGVPDLVNQPLVFDMDDPTMDDYDRLPEWVQEKIKKGLEFEGSPLQTRLNEEAVEDAEDSPIDLEQDELPF
jgi:hypothetical protein